MFSGVRGIVRWRWRYACRCTRFQHVYVATDAAIPPSREQKAPSSHESPSFLHDPVAQKFVNCMMWDGKKTLSQKILREALAIVKRTQLARYHSGDKEVELDPLKVFHCAIENSMPIMGTQGLRKSGRMYQIPVALPDKRKQFLAIKWMIQATRGRSGRGTASKLAAELLDAYNNQGSVIKRKQELHRLAEANRAFAHWRW